MQEERSVQVDRDGLAGIRRLLRDLKRRLGAVREEEALNVEELRALDEGRDFWRGEVGFLEELRCTQGSH